MKLNNLLKYAFDNKSNDNLECEIKFGKYNKLSSNISKNSFIGIYNRLAAKKYEVIHESIYKTETDSIKKREYLPVDIKTLYKKLPKLTNEQIQEQINMLFDTTSRIKTEYTEKKTAYKGYTTPKYKAKVNIEINTPTTHISGKPYMIRKKCRCTSVDKFWQYDITIINIHDLETNRSGVFYEVEIELLHKKMSDVDSAVVEARKHINMVTTVLDCARPNKIDIEIKYSIYNAVVTMEREDLAILQNSRYTVVDKADGERRFLYIDNKQSLYHFNPTETLIDKKLIQTKCGGMPNTLIDCELIDKTFYGFDLLFCNNTDVRNCNMETRVKFLTKMMTTLSGKTYGFTTKKFYMSDIFNASKHIWKNRKKLFPYELDGLIYTPLYGSYLSNLHIFKFKPVPSIDVRVMYNSRDNFTEFYTTGRPIIKQGRLINGYNTNGKTYYKSRIYIKDAAAKHMNLVNKYDVLGVVGKLPVDNMVDIVEIEYNSETKLWEYLRKRPDKERPNAYKSIMSVIKSITDNITIDEISKLKWKESQYDIARKNLKCSSNVGFNFANTQLSNVASEYMTFIYSKLLADKKVLSIGCNPYLSAYLNNSTIIEPNCLQVFGRMKSEGYSGICENIGHNTQVIWGELDKKIIQYNSTKKNIKKHDIVFINVFEHLFFDKKTNKFNKDLFLSNMKCVSSLSDIVVGLFLDATQIIKHLDKADCVLINNAELHPLYKIYMGGNNIKYSSDIFKSNPCMVEIKKMPNSYFSTFRPAVFTKNIADIIKLANMEIMECGLLSSFYKEFKTIRSVDKPTLMLSDIQGYFIAKKKYNI